MSDVGVQVEIFGIINFMLHIWVMHFSLKIGSYFDLWRMLLK
jgi:hypothetical protein